MEIEQEQGFKAFIVYVFVNSSKDWMLLYVSEAKINFVIFNLFLSFFAFIDARLDNAKHAEKVQEAKVPCLNSFSNVCNHPLEFSFLVTVLISTVISYEIISQLQNFNHLAFLCCCYQLRAINYRLAFMWHYLALFS